MKIIFFAVVLYISQISAQDYLKIRVENFDNFLNSAIENGEIVFDSSAGKFVTKEGINWRAIQKVVDDDYDRLQSYKIRDLTEGLMLSALSGISFGAHEAYAFNFRYSGWLGDNVLKDWYNWRPKTEAVFGRIFTWHKVWRELDYYSFNKGYEKINRYFGNKWYITYPLIWIVRNTFATMIRDKFKTDNWFYSFDIELFFSIPLIMGK